MAQYRALYDYLPDEEAYSYMALRVNDWIDKVKDVGNGWFMGFNSNTGDFGIFPASYVEKVEKLYVKSDIAGRLLFLPDNPTAPPSEKVRNEIRRMKEAVNNDQIINVNTRATIKIEPTPASESEEGTIEKIDMTALKAEINRQLMMKRTTEEEPTMNEEPEVTDVSTPEPFISHPKPVDLSSKPPILTPKPKITKPKPIISSPKPIISSPKPIVSSPKPKHQKPSGLTLPQKPDIKEQQPSPPHHKLVIGNPVLQEPIDNSYPVPLQPIGSHDNHLREPSEPPVSVPLPAPPVIAPVPTSPVHVSPAPIQETSHPTISAPILQEPIVDSYPVPLQPIGNHDNHFPEPSPPPVSVPVPISPVHVKPAPIQQGSHPIISAPILQEPFADYPVPLQPIVKGQPLVQPPPPKPKTPEPTPIIPMPVPETHITIIQDPNRPTISAPILIEDTDRPFISSPIPIEDSSNEVISTAIPIPLVGRQSLGFPDPPYPAPVEESASVVVSVPDIPLETDRDTRALVTDPPAKTDKKQKKTKEKPVKEKKVKEKKPKKVKEKKPPFDFKGRFFGCIADCAAKNPLKTVLLGILGGLLSGGIVFVLLVFSFNYDYDVAGWITLGVTSVFSFFLALSATFRCLVLLMVPTLVTGRGRTAILAVIFAILLTGPVLNISANSQEVSSSMACTSELIYNQTKALKHQLLEPLIKIAERINQSFSEVKALADSLLVVIQPIINTIQDFQDAAQKAFDKLQELSLDCKNAINGAHSTCVSGINSAKKACEDFFNSIDPTDDIVNGIKDLGKSLGFGKRRKRDVHLNTLLEETMSLGKEKLTLQQKGKLMQVLQSLGKEKLTLHQRGKLMQILQSQDLQSQILQSQALQSCQMDQDVKDAALQCVDGRYNRSRRGILDNICVVLDISGLCDVLNIANPICGILDTFANIANDSVQEIKSLLDKMTNFFVFGLNTTFDISGGINSSQTSEQIVNNVKADILSKTTVVLYYAKIIGQVLACSLIFLLLRSFLYLSKWRAKESYDNIYITKEFVKYDTKRKNKGKESILPLKSREKHKYIVTNSILMAPMELKTCQKGAALIGRSLLISTIIIAIDYALYYILVLIETYGNINISVSGTGVITLNVEGNSIIAVLLRALASAVAIDYDYNIDFNMTTCLPNPHAPDTRNIYLIVFLYLMAFVFMFMQAYGLRIRRKVAAHYYPEIEFDRIQYLHSKIRIKRRTIVGWIAHLLTSRKKEQDVSERMTFGSWFYYSCPFMANLCNCKPAKTICLNCDRESDGLLKFHICQTKGCDAVYCTQCFKELNETCHLCQKQ